MKINKRNFVKDTIFILLSLLSLLIFSFFWKINNYMSITFFVIYAIYVIISIFMSTSSKVEYIEEGFNIKENISLALLNPNNIKDDLKLNLSIFGSESVLEGKRGSIVEKEIKTDDLNTKSKEKKEEESQSIFTNYIAIPTEYLLKLIILPPNVELWNKYFASISSLVGGLFFLFSNNMIDDMFHIELFPIIIVGICIVLFVFAIISNRNLHPSYILLFIIFSVIMSINFIGWVSNFIVDFLNLLGFACNLDIAFLGITILAIGNSIGDLIADFTMAQKGMGEMAITGTFSSPTFNLLIGLGCSLLITNIKTGKPVPFSINNSSIVQPMLALISAFIIIVHFLSFSLQNKYSNLVLILIQE